MALNPPFTIHNPSRDGHHGKRVATGSETGVALASGSGPAAMFNITYRENFRFHRIYKLASDTPAWAAEAEGSWSTTPPSVTLPAGTLFVQTELGSVARRRGILSGGRKVRLVLGQVDNGALTPEFTPAQPQLWLPLDRHPDDAPSWKSPGLLKNAPTNQWGIRGDFEMVVDPFGAAQAPRLFKMVTVWERWTRCELFPCDDSAPKTQPHWTEQLFTLRPGAYAAYVQVMPRHSSEVERRKFPSIKVAWEWRDDVQTWESKAPSAKDARTRRGGCFIHPGAKPTAFLGCISPGPVEKATPWGFWQVKYCREAMWSIFDDLGIDEKTFAQHRYPSSRNAKWILIHVNDPSDVCGIRAASAKSGEIGENVDIPERQPVTQ